MLYHETNTRTYTKTAFRQNVESATYCQREISFIFYIIKRKKIYLFKTASSKLSSLETPPLIAKPHVMWLYLLVCACEQGSDFHIGWTNSPSEEQTSRQGI